MASYCTISSSPMGNLTKYDIILKANDGYEESQSYAFGGNPATHTTLLEDVVRQWQTGRDALVTVVQPTTPIFIAVSGSL